MAPTLKRKFNARPHPLTAALLTCFAGSALAQSAEATLPEVNVTGGAPSVARKYQLPASTESVTSEQLNDSVNLLNTEDAVKYLPSALVRKRHIGDTQAPLATRTSGLGASARSLIYADGVLLSPLIANNNTLGGPRWGMVAPEEIERVDLMYGPFSAAYAGNSIGSVLEITTRMPKQFEAGAKLQSSWQRFDQYGTHDTYNSTQASALLGNRTGDFSWWLSANHLDTHSQPLAYVTVARPATTSGAGTPVSGAYVDANRNGNPIYVVGAGALEHQIQDNFKFKLAYDFSPQWRATYTVGLFQNNTKAQAQSYLSNTATGTPVYVGGATGINIGGYNISGTTLGATAFTNNVYNFNEEHVMQSFALKSDTRGAWDWEAVVSNYDYGQSVKRMPTTALPAAQGGGPGTIEYLNGTGWSTADLRGFWRPQGLSGAHQVSFGAHYDRYNLADPKVNTSDWLGGGNGALATDSRGKTQTAALWLQDAWRFAPAFKATLGGRYENWRAFDGYNYAATPALSVNQPGLTSTRFSPKASLSWQATQQWAVTASLGRAYRFPTVTELYQAVTTGATITVPNPNLKPENALASELAFERVSQNGRVRISLFQEDLKDALLSQSAPLVAGSTTLFSYVQNIEKVRTRGVELVAQQYDVLVRGLEVTGSLTYADSRIVQDSAYAPAVGKITPGVPTWRATVAATYRPNDQWSGTVAARYSGRQFSQIDNYDGYGHTYQGFESFFVVDARLRYQIDRQWSAALGIDNLNNNKYFLFHPFPQRTLSAELRYRY